MVERDNDENTTEDVTRETTNFHDLCEIIPKLDSSIAGALVIKRGKILATSIGAGGALPSDEYLSKLIRQAEVIVGLPLANRHFFGDLNFILVSYERLDNILFFLETQKAILGVGIIPPYDISTLTNKIQRFLRGYYLLDNEHSIV
jgi:hypothetical protein